MEEDNQITQVEDKSRLHTITPLSKYLAMVLFVVLPFIGGYIGYTFAPEKVMEVEKVIVKEILIESESAAASLRTNITADSESFQCVEDSDCVLVQPDCEDCTFNTISQKEVAAFEAEKRAQCDLNPPEIMCDTVFMGGS